MEKSVLLQNLPLISIKTSTSISNIMKDCPVKLALLKTQVLQKRISNTFIYVFLVKKGNFEYFKSFESRLFLWKTFLFQQLARGVWIQFSNLNWRSVKLMNGWEHDHVFRPFTTNTFPRPFPSRRIIWHCIPKYRVNGNKVVKYV